MGRTHLQDAVPIRLGARIQTYESAKRSKEKFSCCSELKSVTMDTAVGTGLNADPQYIKYVEEFKEISGYDLFVAEISGWH